MLRGTSRLRPSTPPGTRACPFLGGFVAATATLLLATASGQTGAEQFCDNSWLAGAAFVPRMRRGLSGHRDVRDPPPSRAIAATPHQRTSCTLPLLPAVHAPHLADTSFTLRQLFGLRHAVRGGTT